MTSSDDKVSTLSVEREYLEEVDTATLPTSDVSYLLTQSSSVYEGTGRHTGTSVHWEWLSDVEDDTTIASHSTNNSVTTVVYFQEVDLATNFVYSGPPTFAQYRAEFWDTVAQAANTTGLGKIYLNCLYSELRRIVNLEEFYNTASFNIAFSEYLNQPLVHTNNFSRFPASTRRTIVLGRRNTPETTGITTTTATI